jgi:TonB family protein
MSVLLHLPAVLRVHPATSRQTNTKQIAALLLAFAMTFALPLAAHASDREIVARSKPAYPEMAKRMKITGSVLLNATVAPDGKVKSVNTIMGNGMLAEAAKEAVLKWKFVPTEQETIEEVEVVFP